jgi:predicted MFS family arabinose efflux permease
VAIRRASPNLVLVLLFAAVFLAITVAIMLGPLLVELAAEFDTSVAVAGQLRAANAVSWAIMAPLIGPISDTYGRRLVVLTGLLFMTLGVLGAGLAWSYGSLMTFMVLTGIGAATIPPNSIAAVADLFPDEKRGKAISWLISSIGIGTALGAPLVAFLADLGGWRLPFFAISFSLLALWVALWVWLPRSQGVPGGSLVFFSRFRELGSQPIFWYVLIANCLVVIAFIGVFSYLAAYLIQTYDMEEREVALPLALAGLGVVAGSIAGGRVTGHSRRWIVASISIITGGIAAGFVFANDTSPWFAVTFAFITACFLTMTWPITTLKLMELAGKSRATATGLFAVSNQLGSLVGASVGGLMLLLGGFSLVGILCLCAAVIAAAIVATKVRDAQQFSPCGWLVIDVMSA